MTQRLIQRPALRLILGVLLGVILVCLARVDAVFAEDPPMVVLPVDKLMVDFARPNVAGLPSMAEIQKLEVRLGTEDVGPEHKPAYVKYTKGHAATFFTIASLSQGGPKLFRQDAIAEITTTIREYINRQGFVVVQVQPDSKEIDQSTLQDNRNGSDDLHLIIYMGVVSELRSVASGNRIPKNEERVNHPLHRATTQLSPVSPATGESLVRKDKLDSYVFALNRQPGRRVDIAVSQADPSRPGYQEGDIVLDYLISENKPWSVLIQGSNTGTAQTSQWRERFGYTNNELTNHDDIFSVDFNTSNFNLKSQAFDASYDAPLFHANKLRARVYGSYDAFTASDLGTGSENFIGEQSNGGGELTVNVYQQRDKFVDVFGGGQYSHIRTNLNPSATPGSTGSVDIGEPYVGIRAESDSDRATTVGSLTFRYGLPFNRGNSTHAYAGPSGLDQLGRSSANGNFPLLQGDVVHSFFLEPILFPDAFKPESPTANLASTQSTPHVSTLANELVFTGRGQYSGGKRLIPQEQEAIGGLYSVRGYPESFVAGDTVVIGSAEYRLHIPRLFAVQREPGRFPVLGSPFRWSPQQAYGRPDWDLLGRAFFDAGFAHSYTNGSKIAEPSDEVLFGTGLGLEAQFSPDGFPTIDIRSDWGIALRGADSGNQHTSAGSQRFSFVFTLLY